MSQDYPMYTPSVLIPVGRLLPELEGLVLSFSLSLCPLSLFSDQLMF